MNLNLCIVSATPSLIREAVREAATRAQEPIGLYFHMNACEPFDVRDIVPFEQYERIVGVLAHGTRENVGCTMGMHIIWRHAKARKQVASGESWDDWTELVRELDVYMPHAKDDQRPPLAPDDLFVYIHDDLAILEDGWDVRIKNLFRERPQAMLAGFGGARQLGMPELYKVPYQLHQLARGNFASNMTNAEQHGRRTTTTERSATLDSFTLILRSSFLDELEGWKWWPYPCHNFDNAVSCEARKRNYETWLIPVYCHHQGGMTSCAPVYQEWAKAKYGGDVKVHADSHVVLYENYRGVLPIYV